MIEKKDYVNVPLPFVVKLLHEEFANGNIKHTFNPELVSNQRYIDTFIQNLLEEVVRS